MSVKLSSRMHLWLLVVFIVVRNRTRLTVAVGVYLPWVGCSVSSNGFGLATVRSWLVTRLLTVWRSYSTWASMAQVSENVFSNVSVLNAI